MDNPVTENAYQSLDTAQVDDDISDHGNVIISKEDSIEFGCEVTSQHTAVG
jgi:hypothetical protein